MTESERIKRFEAAYNRVDHALGDLAGADRNGQRRTFSTKVRIASHRVRRLEKFKDFLLEIGDLRNALVHNRTGDELYLAVPSERTVLELERIEQAIIAPARVIPRFAREVLTLTPQSTLFDAWSLVRSNGYSRYPVYGPQGFAGLLTGNGFTRWCAGRMNDGRLDIDARAISVADVLAEDHRRDMVAFVSRDALVDEVEQLFRGKKPLEAVIITERGEAKERPLGLVCAGDLWGDPKVESRK